MSPDNMGLINQTPTKMTEMLNYRRINAILKKEFLHIIRDARSLVIVFLAPVVMLVLYGYALTFDIRKIDLAIVDNDNSSVSRRLIDKLVCSGYFEIFSSARSNIDKNIKAMRVNKVKVIMVIPANFSKDIKRSKEVKIQVLADGSDSNTANVALGYAGAIISEFSRDILIGQVKKRGFNPEKIPVVMPEPRVWYNPEQKSTNFIIPGLIAIIMMLIAALLTSLTIVREKERGTFEQLIATPIKPLELMLGKLIPYVLIGLCDIAIIVLVGTTWFGIPFRGNFFALFVFSILFIFCALGLGLFVSSMAKTQEVAVIGTMLVTMLPSILLSGFVFPIESMPWVVRIFTYVVPARYFLTALRTIFLKADVSVIILYKELLYLLFFGMLFMFISAKRFKKSLD